MEENNNPSKEPAETVAVFTAKTMHCETNEIGFMVAIMPREINNSDLFQQWLMSQTVEQNLIPMEFQVKIGDEIIARGGVEQWEA